MRWDKIRIKDDGGNRENIRVVHGRLGHSARQRTADHPLTLLLGSMPAALISAYAWAIFSEACRAVQIREVHGGAAHGDRQGARRSVVNVDSWNAPTCSASKNLVSTRTF